MASNNLSDIDLKDFMITLETKNCNMILTEKQRKYQCYRLKKLINMIILQLKKQYFLINEV